MRLLLLLGVLVAGCGKKDTTIDKCVACGKEVSVKATTCPHCGEPNPSRTLREQLAEAKEREKEQWEEAQARASAAERRQHEAEDALTDAKDLGAYFLSEHGQRVLALPDHRQVAGMRFILDEGQDPFTPEGKRFAAELHTVRERFERTLHRGQRPDSPPNPFEQVDDADGGFEAYLQERGEIEERAKAARAKAQAERARPLAQAKFKRDSTRLRDVIDRYTKENGKLPDEDTATRFAFQTRDGTDWTLTLKYKAVAANKYVLTGAGPDDSYGTEDDLHQEFEVGK